VRERLAVVTRKGQVTIPVEIRKALGIEEGDRVSFVVDEDEVKLRRTGSVVARTAGAFKGRAPAMTVERLREAAEEGMSEDALRRAGG